ncbi:YybH family protein [Colwellia psychrerythraea]|uniref:Calcium/calmodulin dependent protein kinase II association-domain protein n=1 Tax=Colwellia psychrerythraea TaxID=28229 RepID=A0A099KLN2_COLPS|nr:nuclear transport factor 2 family protein [Colwellia psychrerythraea]KGJ90872.1 Calcium/calmodulin dependent protein kinase II association-domain protein [Colwellia psychrerythraea]
MKSYKLLCFTVLFTVLVPASYAHEDAKKEQIKPSLFIGVDSMPAKVVKRFHHALRTSDKVTARQLLADEVQIFEGGGVERSADEYASHHMLSDMKYLAAIKSKTLEHNVKIMGNSAVSMSRSQTTGTYKGKEQNYQSMETIVLEKQQGEWKIVRIHWSN